MSEPQVKHPEPHIANQASVLAYMAIGLVQGLTLWLLLLTKGTSVFSGRPALTSALLHFAAAAPIAWYLLAASPLTARARAFVALAISLLLAGLAAHAQATAGDGSEPFSFALGAYVLAYMLVVLAAGFDPARRWFSYPRLFEHGWRNAILLGAATALTGTLWVVLWGAAFLLDALGVNAMSRILKEGFVVATLSSSAFSFFILQATLRDDALVTLRKFWLTLNTWFLPLALLLAITWVVALLVIGPEPLFRTRRAALLLFWFVALAVLFMNAAYQDGRSAPYGKWVAKLTPFAWLSVPVLAAVGMWALAVRIGQYGWSVDRLWAMVVGAMALTYGVGYSGSALSRTRWMPTLENTNIVAAIALAIVIVLLTSPIADARRIAVDSQMARLRSGLTSPLSFDFAALKREGGSWGREALAQLAADASLSQQARDAAKSQLAGNARELHQQDHEAALATLRKDIRILPKGAVPDPLLLDLLSRTNADWRERRCLQSPAQCAVWLVDLDGNGVDEAVLLHETDRTVQGTVYAKGTNGWSSEAQLRGPPLPMTEWVQAIEEKTVTQTKPRWSDLQFGAKRFVIQSN